jgi:hypothetical protein
MQKAAPTGFAVEQLEQVIGPSSVIAVARERESSDCFPAGPKVPVGETYRLCNRSFVHNMKALVL